MATLINTTLCYIQKDSSYLMLHRVKKEKDYNKNKWIGIGGKFENTESPEDCVKREVLEETGLTLLDQGLEYRGIVTFVCNDESSPDGFYTEFMHVFWCDKFSGKLFTSDQCDEGELEWVPIAQLNDLPHWKGDEVFIDLVNKKEPFFSLKLVYKDGLLLKSILNGKEIDWK